MTVTVFAPAKINLTLHVGPPGPDGRHPLESVAVFADIGDELSLAPAADLSLSIHGPFARDLQTQADNLVVRAADLLKARFSAPAGAAMTLQKNLPVASGIGGGSADAAAALRGLNELWGLHCPPQTLAQLAAELGADVPACVWSAPVFMTGGGEITTPLSTPALSAVLVNPGVPAPTGAVYRAFDDMGLGETFAPAGPPLWRDPSEALAALAGLRNDLEPPAMRLVPEIAQLLGVLRAQAETRLARMSGSGATCFALCDHPNAANALARRLAAAYPHWWVRAAALGAQLGS